MHVYILTRHAVGYDERKLYRDVPRRPLDLSDLASFSNLDLVGTCAAAMCARTYGQRYLYETFQSPFFAFLIIRRFTLYGNPLSVRASRKEPSA